MATKVLGSEFNDWVQKQINQRQKTNALTTSKSTNDILYQNANDSFIRLTSAVNINDEPTNAKNFQLFSTRFGGVGSTGSFASGVGTGTNSTYAYGFLSDGKYGFSPPPGIVSADIKALNQGSFKEATIEILAHNMDQFEIIEVLYLRVGYTVLLEWGHNMYFDNTGAFIRSNPHEVYTTFLNGGSSQLDVQNKIIAERSGSNGNYDAMHGVVRNFNWNLEKDGSYKISVNIASVGDVFESLKSNTSHPISDATKIDGTQETPENQPPLQFNAQKTTINKILWYLSQKLPASKDMKVDGSHKFYLQGDETKASDIAAGIGLKANQYNDSKPGAQGDVIGFIFPQLNGVNTGGAGLNAQYFIKLGVLLRCLQNFCLLYNPDKNNEALININTDDEESFCFTYARQGSLDPRVCLIDIDKELKLTINPTTGVATSPPTSSASNYTITNTYYDYKFLKIEDTYSSTPAYDDLYDPEQGPYIDAPNDIDSYALSVLPTRGTWSDEFEKFLNDQFPEADSTKIVKKTTNQPGGFVSDLNNIKYSNATTAYLSILEDYVVKDDDQEYQDFKDKFIYDPNLSGTFVTSAVTEGQNYLTDYNLEINKIIKVIDVPTSGGGPRKITLTVTTKRAIVSTYVKSTTGYVGTNVEAENEEDIDVSNNLFDRIRPGSKFRVDPDNYPFIGRTMNIYINMNHVASILQNNVDISSGAISMFTFLDTLMKNVQRALGNLNNFYIPYDEKTNEFSIVDKTVIPQLGSYLLATKGKNPFNINPTEFLTNTLGTNGGSFVREASFKTQISNNFMSQITIGAQANGNIVGTNATLLSKLNVGYTDRIFFEKTTENNKSNSTSNDISTNFLSNVGIVQNLYNAINDGNISDQQIDGAIDAGVDLFNYEIGAYVNEGSIPGLGLLPINLEMTLDGLSGMNIGEAYTADTKLLPSLYRNTTQFIITGVSHKIQNNDWTTTVQSISGPKYDGVTVKLPPKPKTATITIIKDPRWKPSAPPSGAPTTPVTPGSYPGDSRYDPLKTIIFKGESTSYDSLFPSTTYTAVYKVSATTRTIQQIIDEGEQRVAAGYSSTAVGRYQQITRYISNRATTVGLSLTDLFNELNQNKMGESIIDTKDGGGIGDYIKGKNEGNQTQLEEAIDILGRGWTSKPMINKGGSKVGNVVDGTGTVGNTSPGPVAVNVGQVVKALIETRKNFVNSSITGIGGKPVFIPSYITY
jgi:hypothetical protein